MVMGIKWQMAMVISVSVVIGAALPEGWAQDYQRIRSSKELALADLDSLRVPVSQYVGNQACKDCHASTYEVWLGTKHARSYVFLDSEAGKAIAEKEEVSAQPTLSAKCVVCHTTAADVPADFRASGFHIEEGIKCESCHGPGGEHVKGELSLNRQAVLATRMTSPTEEDCLVCHKEIPSHDLLDKKPFDFKKDMAKIAHPVSRDEKLDLLSRRPGAVLSISLRSLISHLY